MYVSLLAMVTAPIGIVKMFPFTLRYCGTTFVLSSQICYSYPKIVLNKCKGIKSNSAPFNAAFGKNVNTVVNLFKTTNSYILYCKQ